MPFAAFMQQALYDPEFGYYTANSPKFGIAGDFVTAPEITPLFGSTLGMQCAPILQQLPGSIILEFGAGTGQLCVDLLTQLEKLQCLPDDYWILEVSGVLQGQQHDLIMEKMPHVIHKVHWLTRWPEYAFSGIILANEVLDAMPVHRFGNYTDGLRESFVFLNGDASNIIEEYRPCTNLELANYANKFLPDVAVPYISEVNLALNSWIKQCSKLLLQGVMIIIDYGFPRHEYYHPDRNQGTISCHYKHRTHANPLIHIGKQDITAHVDFTHVAEAAEDAGFEVAGYTSQAAFLLSCGLLSLLEQFYAEMQQYVIATQAVKKLIEPHEMGELFKVMGLTKNLPMQLGGFAMQDRRASL